MLSGRWLTPLLRDALRKPYVHLLFGARQTGKSTLLRQLLPTADLWIDLSDPAQRSRYLVRPQTLVEETLALQTGRKSPRIVVDEAQAVPALFDSVQFLYDNHRGRFRFVLSGSSARKLRVTGANLLPGRSIVHRLFPLTLFERPGEAPPGSVRSGKPVELRGKVPEPRFPAASLVERLTHGELPGIVLARQEDRGELLQSYAYVYLEEELRREALIKDWPTFARFLRLAALESGQIVNYSKIAKDAGTSAPTVKSYYQLLEDMFIGFHVQAFYGSSRKHVLSTPRFFFFDVGVRHAAAGLENSRSTVMANPGPVFEQWVGIELYKRLGYLNRGTLSYLRTKAGAEIDFLVQMGSRVIPIEVKWTEKPDLADVRHLKAFLQEARAAPHGYLICRADRPQRLAHNITALPWSQL